MISKFKLIDILLVFSYCSFWAVAFDNVVIEILTGAMLMGIMGHTIYRRSKTKSTIFLSFYLFLLIGYNILASADRIVADLYDLSWPISLLIAVNIKELDLNYSKSLFWFMNLVSITLFHVFPDLRIGVLFSVVYNSLILAFYVRIQKVNNANSIELFICILIVIYMALITSSRSALILVLLMSFFFLKNSSNILVPTITVAALLVLTIALARSHYYEEFYLDSLVPAISLSIKNLSIWPLLMWEGNTRFIIVGDAFSGFNLLDYIFGKGIDYKYSSFINRETIEILLLQFIFRFGISFMIVLNSMRNKINAFAFRILILDSLIYGAFMFTIVPYVIASNKIYRR